MRFLGIVAAVLVANLLTLVFLAIAFALLISDQGQAFMRHLGYDISPIVSAYYRSRIIEWEQPEASNMTPITVAPRGSEEKPTPPVSTTRQAPKNEGKSPDPDVVRSTFQTCSFWNSEYRKEGTARSRRFRDSACGRYEELTGRDIEDVMTLARPRQRASSNPQNTTRQSRQIASETRRHEAYCDELKHKIEVYDAKLRAGGDGAYMNYWRGKRREVSNTYAWECLRNPK